MRGQPAIHPAQSRELDILDSGVHASDLLDILRIRKKDGTYVFQETEMETLIRAASKLAAEGAVNHSSRSYAASMKVIFDAVAIKQKQDALEKEQVASQQQANIVFYLPDNQRHKPLSEVVDNSPQYNGEDGNGRKQGNHNGQ